MEWNHGPDSLKIDVRLSTFRQFSARPVSEFLPSQALPHDPSLPSSGRALKMASPAASDLVIYSHGYPSIWSRLTHRGFLRPMVMDTYSRRVISFHAEKSEYFTQYSDISHFQSF